MSGAEGIGILYVRTARKVDNGLYSEYAMEVIMRESQRKAETAAAKARLLVALEETQAETPALRRRLASALVQLAVRIDARAARALTSESSA